MLHNKSQEKVAAEKSIDYCYGGHGFGEAELVRVVEEEGTTIK